MNYSQVNKVISSIYIETDTNTLIQTWIEGIGTGTMIPAGESVTFTITISYPGGLTEVPENTQKGIVIRYEFEDYEEETKTTLLETMLTNEGDLTDKIGRASCRERV